MDTELMLDIYPADGEVFELTFDGEAPENQPLEMVRRYGYTGKWKHEGRSVKGKQTRRFKLVAVGYCKDLDEVKRKLAPHGKTPEGQWQQAFRARYRNPDGNGPIGVADASWVGPSGNSLFPYVDYGGRSYFIWAGNDFRGDWRWLVEVSE